GLEYSFMEYLFIRGGYTYEKGLYSVDNCMTAFSGPSVGMTLQAPLKKKEEGTKYGLNTTSCSTRPVIGVDYSYRFTNVFGGVHTFGLRVTM
ncbi:MAG: hypothetical protein II471_07715, partial [Bacteroidales bacterium]|nr:hypothetical protein [Bacteroidales bacterium]